MTTIYICPGCGRVTDDYEEYSHCKEYHGDHPDSITRPETWKEYLEMRAKRDYEMNTGRDAYHEGMADW